MSAGEFGWQATKDGRVRITWRGRVVTTLAGAVAARFVRQAEDADEDTVQGLLARATGNFKRGNERRP
ncbi:MAG: hypothetical protein ACRELC_05065 [Gemmatimonadota bacterium]